MLCFPGTDSPTFISSRFVDRFTILFLPANVLRLVFRPLRNDRVRRKFTFPCYVQNVLLDQNFFAISIPAPGNLSHRFPKILSSEQLDIFLPLLKMSSSLRLIGSSLTQFHSYSWLGSFCSGISCHTKFLDSAVCARATGAQT